MVGRFPLTGSALPRSPSLPRILRGVGPEGLPTLTIAERMIERSPGITRLLDRLEARGLDTKLVAELEELLNEATDGSLAMLSQKQLRELIALLDAVRGTMMDAVPCGCGVH
jgi:hypothetical protein